MKNRAVITILCIILLITPLFISCVADDPPAESSPLTTIQNDNKALKAWKADVEAQAGGNGLSSWMAKITNEQKENANNIEKNADNIKKLEDATTVDAYTKSQIDNKLNNFIANLTTEQIAQLKDMLGITSVSSSNQQPQQSTIQDTGQVATSWGNGTNTAFVIRLSNNTQQWQYVKPAFVLQTPSPYAAIDAGGILISMQQGNFTWATANFDFLPNLGTTVRSSFDVISFTGGENGQGERYLAPGNWVDVNINISITSTPSTALWTIYANPRTRQ